MTDEAIVQLYWQREEDAIGQTQRKYGKYLQKVAVNILLDEEDGKDSVNEAYLAAWNSMPPQRPSALVAYLAKLTRRCSIDSLRKRHREKRIPSEYIVTLSELEDCVSGREDPAASAEASALAEAIGSYLRTLPARSRHAFVGRYFFADGLQEIAAYSGMSVSGLKSLLYRVRQGLKKYLLEEGFSL